ncbi:MAG TPA: hypothetical protein VF859_14015, partial [Burkholderiales bacterium]
MIVLRLVGVLFLLTLGVSFALYLGTGNRRYLNFALGLIKFGVLLLLVTGALYVIERLVLV